MGVAVEVALGVFTALFASGGAICGALALALRVDQSDRDWGCVKGAKGAQYTKDGVYECTDEGVNCQATCVAV